LRTTSSWRTPNVTGRDTGGRWQLQLPLLVIQPRYPFLHAAAGVYVDFMETGVLDPTAETPSCRVTIDACPGCGGIWLDKEEWEGLVGPKEHGWL